MAGKSQIRERLRAATGDAHERLHHHAGFAAAAAGVIELPAYRNLLARLWGFHRPFEEALGLAAQFAAGVDLEKRRRSTMLESDLAALGLARAEVARLPRCRDLAPPGSAQELLGALYVIEGSTLGGIPIARALGPLCAPLNGAARGFFLGYGDRHGAMWREFLGQLDAGAAGEADAARMVHGATQTFLAFERWMTDWDGEPASARRSAGAAVAG